MKVHEAITAVMSDVGAVGKGEVNSFHKFNFRGIDTTVNALSPAMRRHGLTVRPSAILSAQYEHFTTSGSKQSVACRITVEYTFTGPEGDELKSIVAAESADTGDKATPKAMSVAFRTALLQTFALPTQESDPDAQSYERSASQSPPRDFLAESQAAGSVEQVQALWAEAKSAGAPAEYLDKIAQVGRERKAAS